MSAKIPQQHHRRDWHEGQQKPLRLNDLYESLSHVTVDQFRKSVWRIKRRFFVVVYRRFRNLITNPPPRYSIGTVYSTRPFKSSRRNFSIAGFAWLSSSASSTNMNVGFAVSASFRSSYSL